jgi:hypothetical protein
LVWEDNKKKEQGVDNFGIRFWFVGTKSKTRVQFLFDYY